MKQLRERVLFLRGGSRRLMNIILSGEKSGLGRRGWGGIRTPRNVAWESQVGEKGWAGKNWKRMSA